MLGKRAGMPFAIWDDSYSVKVRRLDDEHQQLFSIINQLHEGMKAGRGKDVLQSVLDQLLRYTEQHFADEEALMQLGGYPWLNAHITLHQGFINKIKGFSKDFRSGAVSISVEMLEFLRNWLAEHIIGSDHQYCELLNSAGIR
jgi:hemerythrin-like metal-binding protein